MRSKLCLACILLLTGPTASAEDELNLFEWTAVAPIVVEALVTGDDGKYMNIQVVRVLRGDVTVGDEVKLALRLANRSRSRNADPKSLKLDLARNYVFLLEEFHPKPTKVIYRLIRGVRGARPVPAEGAEAFFAALGSFIDIQNLKSDNITWTRFAAMLEERNPILLSAALDQMLKFRRGEPDLVLTLRPLLDHPRPDIRVRVARLAGQIVTRFPLRSIPEDEGLRGELVGSARRDREVAVRVAATEALEGFSDASTEEVLIQIAENDPDRAVRFAAERLLLRRRKAASNH